MPVYSLGIISELVNNHKVHCICRSSHGCAFLKGVPLLRTPILVRMSLASSGVHLSARNRLWRVLRLRRESNTWSMAGVFYQVLIDVLSTPLAW